MLDSHRNVKNKNKKTNGSVKRVNCNLILPCVGKKLYTSDYFSGELILLFYFRAEYARPTLKKM